MGGVTIPNSVITIGDHAFDSCTGLASVTLGNGVIGIGNNAFYGCSGLTKVTIPTSATSLGGLAFESCSSLTNVFIPFSVTNIGDAAFATCGSLTAVFCGGNAPALGGPDVFTSANNAIIYYLPGTLGWSNTFGGRLTALWNPQAQRISVQTDGFGFTVAGTTNIPLVVETSTNLTGANWTPLRTRTLTNGSFDFSDPQWTNDPARLYRIRSP